MEKLTKLISNCFRLIDYMRGYVEWMGSILVPVVFFYGGVAILYFRSSVSYE